MTHTNKVKNRILVSVALAVLAVSLTLLLFAPMSVSAAGTAATLVTSSNYSSLGLSSSYVGYYAISTANELVWFADYVNNTSNSIKGVLISDIDLTGLTTWKIMETYYGTFDGRGHAIIGMNKNAGLGDNFRPGFTAYMYGTVKNVVFKNPDVFDQREIGVGVIAHCNYGTISGCMVLNANVQLGNYAGMGFIAGKNYSGGIIENCGAANSWMMRRYEGNGNQSMGGITQLNYGTVRNCYTYNCSFNRGISGSDGALISSGNAPTNSYYYTTSTTVTTYGTAKSAAAFTGGEVAVLLGSTFGQNIDNWNLPDDYPIVGGPALYSMYYCNSSLFAGYSNTNGAKAHQTYSSDGFCTYCGAYQPGTRVTQSNYTSLSVTADHEGYWALGNAGQLYWFSAVVRGSYNNKTQNSSVKTVLSNSITVNSSVLNSSSGLNSGTYREWIPIGNNSSSSNYYKGTFDGNGKTISGLYYNNSSNSYVGLFGYTASAAVIKNVGVTGSYFNGNQYVGAVVGWSEGTITNCYNTGPVSGVHRVGGVVAYNGSSMTHCYNTGTITGGTGKGFGGVAGTNDGTIANCYNIGTVSGSGDYVGGVVGGLWTNSVANCYSTGTVSGSANYVGGVVGSKNSSTTVTNCYYLSDSSSPIGGIDGADAAGSAEAKTTAQFARGEVTYLLQGSQTTQVWGQNIDNGGTTETRPVFSSAKVYERWYCDNSAVESYSNSDDTITHSDKEGNYENGFCTHCEGYQPATLVTSGNYTIGNAGQLYWFAQHVNTGNTAVNATVTAYIDATVSECKYLGIGTESYLYRGVFDGGGNTIELALEGDGVSDNIGLFKFIGGATIRDLHTTGTIKALDSEGTGADQYAAGVVSRAYSGTNLIERVTSDVIITSGISGDGTHGGLVGIVGDYSTLTLNNCGFSGAINGAGTYACGGLIGWNAGSRLIITNCYQAGTFNLYNQNNATINRGSAANTLTNVYYLNAIGTVQGTYKSAEAFESGEVAYLLQLGQSTQVWGQNIDNGNTTETLPVLSSATVYQKLYCDGSFISYTNTAGIIVHVYDHEDPTFVWANDHTSLTVTLLCEKNREHTISGTTTEINVDTTDAEWTVYTGTVMLDGTAHTGTARVENDIISVNISWTEFTFVYAIEWNPETLQYEGAGWDTSTEDGGVITVTNEGNVDVNVSFVYTQIEETVAGIFTDEENIAVTSPVALAVGEEKKIKLMLWGEPGEAFESTPLGTVTVTVTLPEEQGS